jgi:hypothetical protein
MDTSIDVPNPAPGHNGPAVKAKQRNSRAVKFPIQPQEPSLRDKLSDSPPPAFQLSTDSRVVGMDDMHSQMNIVAAISLALVSGGPFLPSSCRVGSISNTEASSAAVAPTLSTPVKLAASAYVPSCRPSARTCFSNSKRGCGNARATA